MNSTSVPVVVKLGGTTLAEEHETLAGVVSASRTQRLVLVHGGGKRLTDWLSALGIESRFEGGRRVTDRAALDIALAVLGGLVNGELTAALRRLGVDAIGLTGVDGGLLTAERVAGLGHVGRVAGVRTELLEALHASGLVPVIAPLALDENSEICNVNADEAAAGLAGALGARLVLMTDTDGVHDADGRRLATLTETDVSDLIEGGVISGGMVPKVQGALAALRSGAQEVVIGDGRTGDSLRRLLGGDDLGTRLRLSDA